MKSFVTAICLVATTSLAQAQTINWTNTSGGSFTVGANWAGGIAPGSGNDAVIATAGTYTVTLNTSTTINSLTLNNSTATFSQSAGTFTINNGFTLTNGIYNLSGGSIALNGTMALNGGTFNLSNATITGGTVAGGGNRLVIGGNATLSNVNVAANTLNLSGTGQLNVTNGTTFEAGSSYVMGFLTELRIGSGQTSLANLALTNSNQVYVYGNVDNASWTLASTSSITNVTGSTFYVGGNSGPIGTNRSIVNDGLIANTDSGSTRIQPSGDFTNTGTLKTSSGTLYLNPAGTYTGSAGTIDLSGTGVVFFDFPMVPSNLGTLNRPILDAGMLRFNSTLTLQNNYDIGTSGSMDLTSAGQLLGGGFSLTNTGNTVARISSVANQLARLSNVNLGKNTLDLASTNRGFELQNGTTFEAGSSYVMGFLTELRIGSGQTSLANLALTNSNQVYVYGNVDNASWTLASTSSITNVTGSTFYVGGNSGPIGTNRSIVNDGLIANTNSGSTRIQPSGTFTNNGTVQATAGTLSVIPMGVFTNNGLVSASGTGTININPDGGLVIGVGSTIEAIGAGIVNIQTPNVSTNGNLSITTGQFGVATTTTANLTVNALGNVAVTSSGILTVGNTSSSTITNLGNVSLATGSQLILGPQGSPGVLNNQANLQVNGNLYARITATAGVTRGSGTIFGTTTQAFTLGQNATLAPGNSPGQISIGGGLDVGGTLELDISQGGTQGNNSNTAGSNQTPGSGFDTIRVTPPPSNNTATNATIRTATTNFKLLTGNRNNPDGVNFPNQPSFANNTAFWGTTEKWRIMNTTNGTIELRDANNNLQSNVGVLANVQLFAIDDPTHSNPINFTATYPTSSFSYEIISNGAGNDLNLVWNPVPEPTVILGMCFVALLGYGVRLRLPHQ